MSKTKLLSIILILFFFIDTIDAQETNHKFVRLGLNISPSLSWMKPSSSDYSSEGSIIGFSYGIMSEFNLVDNYFIATGLHIKSTGGKLKFPAIRNMDTIEGSLNRKYAIRYIEIPLLLKMKTRQIGSLSYFGTFGLGTSFSISASADDEFTSDIDGTITKTDDNDVSSGVNLLKESLVIGAGAEYSLGGSTSIVFSILYNNGFTDILSGKNNKDSSIKENATSRIIELNLGIIF